MTGMVAAWIVAVTLFIVCGGIAFVLARIVDQLDRIGTMRDVFEPTSLAPEPAPELSVEVTASAARADAVDDHDPAQCRPSLENDFTVRESAYGDLGRQQ